MEKSGSILPFKISCLIFITNSKDENLMIKRKKPPNKNCWSPIGGKLDMENGESPYECAIRETREEINLKLNHNDLKCFGYISEKNYEGMGHWLMFLFKSMVNIETTPKAIDEGEFDFFSRHQIDNLAVPETDKTLLWPYYDSHSNGFIGLSANCEKTGKFKFIEELSII